MVKPKITIKKVKGHRYLQLTDIYGNLIHIGNADDVDNWMTAITALGDQYHALTLLEALALDKDKTVEALRGWKLTYRYGPAWDKYCEKRIQKKLQQKFLFRIIENDMHNKADHTLLQEVEDEKKG